MDPSLIIYNSIGSTGINYPRNIKELYKIVTDLRSKANLKMLLRFYTKHAVNILAYGQIIVLYYKIIGGFIKWKTLGLFGIKRKKIREK